MHLVADRLARDHESVAAIAYALGYESESAFSVVSKRVLGCAPGRYARELGGRDSTRQTVVRD